MKQELTFVTKVKSLFFALLFGAPLVASAQGIEINAANFPDPYFRNFLLAQYYGQDGVLTDEEIEGIISINVLAKDISNLKGIEYFTALRVLWCGNNRLTALDVSKNTALTDLSCYNNQLTALDVSKNTALTNLHCSSNQLTALDVSKNTALMYLYCDDNQLTVLDVSGCTALEWLQCDGNQLTALDVSGCTALTVLHCERNLLTTLDVSGCVVLRYLYCYNNKIQGASMDALISSLPQNNTTKEYLLYVYNPDIFTEGNICTKTQVAAIKAKGWIPYYGLQDNDPTAITRPITETVEVNAPVYTISGQKVTGSLKGKKGVYIVGGKKVVVE